MFDGDDAGKKATWAARVPCRAAALSVRGAAVPAGMDPDDMAQKQGPEAVATLLSGALPLAQRLLDVLLRDGEFEGRAVHDQAARARAALQLISEAGDDVERTVLRSYADRLAQGLRVSGLQELEAALRRPARAEQPKAATTLAQEMSLAMLGALLDFPELLDHADVRARADLMTGGAVLGVLALRGPMDTLLARLPEDLQPFAAHRLAAPLFDSPDEALRSFRAYAKKIHAANLRRPAEAR
jgi:DNA primase